MNVLSLFDGMSCAQIALKELGIIPVKYYASEIDKYAIAQTQLNFPNTVQLGSVTEWKDWDIDFSSIDLLCAGSPCQGFSFAGKQLAFDDPRSKLFFVFIDILNHIKELNPEVKFLLENVDMKKEHRRVINEMTGVFGQNVNSNLVSAQNRSRWYWHNIKTKLDGLFDEVQCDIPQPKDQDILLRDILESEVDEKYYISRAVINRMNRKEYSQPQINPEKTGSLNTKNNSGSMSLDSGTTFISIDGKSPTQRSVTGRSLSKKHNYQIIELTGILNDNGNIRETEKSNCVDANYWKGMDNHAQRSMVHCVSMVGRKLDENGVRKDYSDIKAEQRLEPRFDGKTNCLTSVQKDNLVMIQREHGFNKGGEVAMDGKTPPMTKSSWEQNNLVILGRLSGGKWDNTHDQNKRVYGQDGKMQTLQTMGGGNQHPKTMQQDRIRRLTPLECARLQTIPDWYDWSGMSDTQRYRCLGNGWTINIIAHIFSFL